MSFQILVVDDTKFMRKMLTDILKQYGHEVVGEAENGRQAVQKYEELQPDIVLMDITMPEMDGIEAMKEIRLLNPSAVVLICSAMSQQDLISDALKAGANGYVMKPFKPNRVNEIVRKYGVPRVIGHLIPQDMQRTEPVPLEIEVVEPEAIELQQTIVEPEVMSQIAEERKTAAKPAQVVNALEVLLAFAEVAESKAATETTEVQLTEEVPVPSQSTSEEDRLAEMEKLAAAMQGDLEQEWQLEQTEEAAVAQMEEPLPSENVIEVAEQSNEEIVQDTETNSIELSLDDLNDLTMEMEFLASAQEMKDQVIEVPVLQEEVPISTSYKSQESVDVNKVGFKAVNGGKIINLFRGNGPMKNFTSSIMCNWSEELNGEMSQYLVVCTEAENKIEIEMATAGGHKQSITVTIESFNQLAAWLQVQLGTAPVSNREYAKKADF